MTHDQPIIQYVRLQISFRSPNFECKCICLYHWSGDKIWKLKIDKRPKKTPKKKRSHVHLTMTLTDWDMPYYILFKMGRVPSLELNVKYTLGLFQTRKETEAVILSKKWWTGGERTKHLWTSKTHGKTEGFEPKNDGNVDFHGRWCSENGQS